MVVSGPLVIGLNGLMVWAKLGYWLEDPYSDTPRILKGSQPILRSPGFVPGFSSLVTRKQKEDFYSCNETQ